MSKRLLGVMVVLLALFAMLAVTAPAQATEGGEAREVPSFSELGKSDAAQEFLPEEYELPGFFKWLILPLLIIGVVAVLATLLRYLVYQPRFAKESEEKARR